MGRPSLGDEAKRHVLTLRVTKQLRDRLAVAAEETGRSTAQEVEHRLERMFYDEHMRSLGPTGRSFIEMLAATLGAIQARTGKSFDEDYATWMAFRSAINVIIDDFDPGFPEAERVQLDRIGNSIAAENERVEEAKRRLCKVAALETDLPAERALVGVLDPSEADDELAVARLGLQDPESFDARVLDPLEPSVREAALSLIDAMRRRSRAADKAFGDPNTARTVHQFMQAGDAAAGALSMQRRRLLPPKMSRTPE